MEHLAAQGIPCPTPIHGRDGKALRRLCGRPAAIVTFLAGMWPRRIHPEHCAAVGDALAQLHRAGATFDMQRRNSLSVEAWRPLLEASAPRADTVLPGLAKRSEEHTSELQSLMRNSYAVFCLKQKNTKH